MRMKTLMIRSLVVSLRAVAFAALAGSLWLGGVE